MDGRPEVTGVIVFAAIAPHGEVDAHPQLRGAME